MKVILLKDVPKVGRKLEAVEVADGYANNYLFPKELAERATQAKLDELEKRREALRAEDDARLEDIREKLSQLADRALTITVKADDQGHLFKKVRAADIVDALAEELELTLPEEAILLDEPIHEVGSYDVELDAAGEKATVKVEVVSE